MDNHKSINWDASIKILEYVKVSSRIGLLFKNNEHLKMEAYPNVNHVG